MHAIGVGARRTDPTRVRCTEKTSPTLDAEANQVCRDVGLPMPRAATVNDDPMLLEMMADEVVKTWDRYRTGGR